MDLQNLIVGPGDTVRAWGVLGDDRGRAFLSIPGAARYSDMNPAAVHWSVTIRPSLYAYLVERGASLEQGPIDVVGDWDGVALSLSEHTTVGFGRPRAPDMIERPGQVRRAVSSTVQTLFRDGVLTGYRTEVREDGTKTQYAIAPDPGIAEAALRDSTESSLVIIPGAVTKRQFDDLANAISEAEDEINQSNEPTVASLGRGYRTDHTPVVTASMRYITAPMASCLTPFPEEALELELLLRPWDPSGESS